MTGRADIIPFPPARRDSWLARFPRDLHRRLFFNGTFVSLCAVALAWETSLVTSTRQLPILFYAFVFFATLAGYRLHAIANPHRRRTLGRGFVAITLATAVTAMGCALALPPRFWPAIAIAGAVTWAYSLPVAPGRRRLREFGVAKIVALAGVWTLVTAYLPAAGAADGPTLAFLLLRRFAFMFALCLVFDVRDHEHDARAGIRTLPVLLGVKQAYTIARWTLIFFALLVLAAPFIQHGHRPAVLVMVALLASAAATWFAIDRSRRHGDSHLYYLRFVDGMMLVQAALVTAAFWASTWV